MRGILALFLISFAMAGLGQPASHCVVCEGVLVARYYWFDSPALQARKPVCEPCSKLSARCSICRLPVRNGQQLDDGRWLCRKDFDSGVFSPTEALRIYEETRRELQEILAGTGVLPSGITVSLVDGNKLKKQNQAMPSAHEDLSMVGLTRTRLYGGKQFKHEIYLLNGLGRARLAAVCAHEYTHAWIHENVSRERKLDRDAVEGFCELVAYKLMTRRKEAIEQKVILANAYTRGQVNAFVQAEAAQHFHRVVEWIKTGVDGSVPQSNLGSELALGRDEPGEIAWPPPLPTMTAVPDTLVLKGISGGRARRFVLINDATLMRNEVSRVRIGSSNVLVRCVEIRDRSAVIHVKGAAGPTELFLGAN